MSSKPELLPLDPAAVRWSVPASDVPHALSERPLLVLLHGYGANADDLAGLFPLLSRNYVVASLQAPLPLPQMPAARAWFPLDPERLGRPDPDLVNAATAGVLRWLETVHASSRTHHGVGLLGFSQGGALATQLLRHRPESFDCAVILSGFVAPGLLSGDEALEQIKPPVFTGHDDADPIIPAEATARLGTFLRAHSTLTARTYTGVGHGISGPEMDDVVTFLGEHLRLS